MSLTNGYLVTRSELDGWSEKRPTYTASGITSTKCLSLSEITSNYFVTGATESMLSTFDDLSKIKFMTTSIKNNSGAMTSYRIAYKGSSESTYKYSPWVYNIPTTGTVLTYCENLTGNTNYYVYLNDGSTNFGYLFVNGQYNSNNYFTPVTGTTAQKNQLPIMLQAGGVTCNLHITTNSNAMKVNVYNGTYNLERQGTNLVFENVPWNAMYSIDAYNVSGQYGLNYSATDNTGFYSFDVVSAGEDYINIEVDTGSNFDKTDYYVTIHVDV